MLERAYDVKGGKLTVNIEPAVTREDGVGRDRHTVEVPELNVKGEVTIRGRVYSTEGHFRWGTWYGQRDERREGWMFGGWAPYNGRHKNDKGLKVDYNSVTDGQLDALCHEVLDLYRVDVPNWESVSVALYRRNLVARSAAEVINLNAKLNEAVAAEAALRSKYAADLRLVESL